MGSERLYLREDFAQAWAGSDPFAVVDGLDGEVFRALEHRKTLAFIHQGRRYFAKIHKGTSWREIFKNLFQLRLPVISAGNEWRALQNLKALHLAVPEVAAYGRRGLLPTAVESFIITEDIGTQLNLEDLTATWRSQQPGFVEKLALIREVANISRTMHGAGICHRDFYICHFLVSEGDKGRLILIDLHRALVKKNLGRRWVVKDIGSLYFSAMDIGLTQRDLLRFVKYYGGAGLRLVLQRDRSFWRKVRRRAMALTQKHKP